MKHFRIFCLLVTSVFVGGSGVAFGHDAACGTLGDEDLILTLPCVVSGDKAYSATLLPIKRPDGNVGKWTLQAGSVKSASFDPGNNNCANFNAGVSLAVRCVLHDGALWSAEFGANYPVFDLRSYEPYTTNELFGDSLGSYEIGGPGPQGGIVYQVDETGLIGKEVDIKNANDEASWGCAGKHIVTNIEKDTGQENTKRIIEGCPGEITAAQLAHDHAWPSGNPDGYLPSRDELQVINDAIGTLQDLAGLFESPVWSSSEVADTTSQYADAWSFSFPEELKPNGNPLVTETKDSNRISLTVRDFDTTVKYYKIGDKGPQGGIVFIATDCVDGLGCPHGTEAALEDVGLSDWYHASGLATSYTWPTGKQGGFLPSIWQLGQLFIQRKYFNITSTNAYWSSSEDCSDGCGSAWVQRFCCWGGLSTAMTNRNVLVRAVRYF